VRLPVKGVGRYIIEPDAAVVRAGLFAELVGDKDAWLLDAHTAYRSSDESLASPVATDFEGLEALDPGEARLRKWVREHQVGTLEIKKRAIDLDPAALRRRLRPEGPNSATLIIARTTGGTRAFAVERLPRVC
jgi:hypothetical protein